MIVGRAAGQTDTGRKRRRNEDAFVCDPPLFAIADGIGRRPGRRAGLTARRRGDRGAAAAVSDEGVVGVVRTANARIFQRSLQDHGAAGMGTAAIGDHPRRRARRHPLRRPRQRLARLPVSRRHPRAADDRPLARRRARPQRAAHRGPRRRCTPPSLGHRALGTEAEVDVDTLTVDCGRTTSCSSARTGSPRWCGTTR